MPVLHLSVQVDGITAKDDNAINDWGKPLIRNKLMIIKRE